MTLGYTSPAGHRDRRCPGTGGRGIAVILMTGVVTALLVAGCGGGDPGSVEVADPSGQPKETLAPPIEAGETEADETEADETAADETEAAVTDAGSTAGAPADTAETPVTGSTGSTLAPDPVAAGVDDRIAGTDSAPATPGPVGPELEALLFDFGHRYLAYDYRTPEDERIEGLRPLVTPELFALLSQPLPLALAESLAAERRVVTAEPLAAAAIEPQVFAISFAVTTSSEDAADREATEETRLLTVTVDGLRLVSDVR